MNSVQLIGRLAQNIEIRYTDTGNCVGRFTLAVDRKFKKDGGESADFISCVAFGKTAEFIEKWFQKGQRIGLIGRIQTGSYINKEGIKRYTTDVIIENVEFVENQKRTENFPEKVPEVSIGDGFMSIPDDIEDGSLPFK